MKLLADAKKFESDHRTPTIKKNPSTNSGFFEHARLTTSSEAFPSLPAAIGPTTATRSAAVAATTASTKPEQG